ncbi:MAG: alpha/beta fold hydrolase, partial [Xenococcus sp. MO_188.B8]|nr:alpha/beta fold hydrolase [Xenococcus sp. MO_188.B8]
LHGVPTSSFVWRNIIPELADNNRVIVPDLINFGLSDKTEEPLDFVEHGQLLNEFIESLDLNNITFVGHDWGGPISLTYAVNNQNNVEALAFFESPVVPLPNVATLQSLPGGFFETFIDPANSETNIVDNNLFIEGYLFNPEFGAIAETPTDLEQVIYGEPFLNAEDREQLLTFPLELPILDTTGHPFFDPDGVGGLPPNPVPNIETFVGFANYLAATDVPKLLIYGTPGFTPPELVLSLAESFPGFQLEQVGDAENPAFHFLQEDVPEQLSGVLGEWIDTEVNLPTEGPTVETRLQITVENLAPDNGVVIAPSWFAFHDGSFDLFDLGGTASPALELLAEDGISALEAQIPGVLEDAVALGLNLDIIQPGLQAIFDAGVDLSQIQPPNNTLAGLFLESPAGINGGIQAIGIGDNRVAPFFFTQNPGETVSTTVTLDDNVANNRFFSYAAMLFPTNDGFIANDEAIEIFDEAGNFIGADFVVFGSEALDAGTEVNDEDPSNLLYTFEAAGNSVDENGTIQPFPGFIAPGEGGALDFEINGERVFANADFTAPDYQIARITVSLLNSPVKINSTLDGSQEVAPGDPIARGTSVLTLNETDDGLIYSLTVTGLDFGANGLIAGGAQTQDTSDDVTRLHIHNAARGVNGDVVFSLFDTVAPELGNELNIQGNQDDDLVITLNNNGSVTLSGVWDETDPANTALSEFVTDIRNTDVGADLDLYWNVHTEEYPSGAIRGQLVIAEDDILDTPFIRFQNSALPGTYIYATGAEADNIRVNFTGFIEEGVAFKAAITPDESLIPLYRFQSNQLPGSYIYVGDEERNNINADPNLANAFNEEGVAFYVYGAGAGIETPFSRFQNSAVPGTYLYATGDEANSIRSDFPNFMDEGFAFEAEI